MDLVKSVLFVFVYIFEDSRREGLECPVQLQVLIIATKNNLLHVSPVMNIFL